MYLVVTYATISTLFYPTFYMQFEIACTGALKIRRVLKLDIIQHYVKLSLRQPAQPLQMLPIRLEMDVSAFSKNNTGSSTNFYGLCP